ncbi:MULTISPECIES: hypothetical protein [unclassified Spiroplasma]|uniref:hypothetical protein n=1 Tax=unclassified Spiroplasma TaxID=2637901 RepID=UPI0030D265BE
MVNYKKINWFILAIIILGFLFMIIGLSLLTSKVLIGSHTELVTNGFGLIAGKYKEYSHLNGILDVFNNNLNDWFNISNVRCGVVFTIFLTPIFLSISIICFLYNYYIFKFPKK